MRRPRTMPRRCAGAAPDRIPLRRRPGRPPHLATSRRPATTTMPGSDALPARPPWPPRIPASGSLLSPAHHQVDALQHPDRDDPADAARAPDPVVDDHRRSRGPVVNGRAIANEGERNDEKVVIGAFGL